MTRSPRATSPPRAQAPLVPGTPDPVKDADEVVAFAKEYGVPIAIKAAFGGGGRGMKVARTIEEIPELFESAIREAVAAFGRGECFVERYLDKPRHVEAQVIADQHGNVVVAGTRDCSLQRRFQKLVEEAPAPFLTDAQRKEIHESAKRICKEAHYYGAGTVEYLVGQDGLISFLEVNTRLQVEHPVTEETAGIDLVLQQFKIANGEKLDITEDPTPRGHAIEFRINGEDAGRGFLPAPGPVTRYDTPSGPGVRLDSGVEAGSVIGGQFDSMLAKLIVYGATRDGGAGPRRAGRWTSSTSRAWPPSSRSTARWCPTRRSSATTTASRCTPAGSRPSGTTPSNRSPAASLSTRTRPCRGRRSLSRSAAAGSRCRCPVTWRCPTAAAATRPASSARSPSRASAVPHGGAAASGDAVTAPMQGTVVKVAVEEGQEVVDRRPGRGPGGDEDGEPGHRAQRRHHHRTGRRGRRRHHPGHGARRDQVARLDDPTWIRSRSTPGSGICAACGPTAASTTVPRWPTSAITDPEHVARSDAQWSADTCYSWAVCEVTTGELLAEVTLDPATGEIATRARAGHHGAAGAAAESVRDSPPQSLCRNIIRAEASNYGQLIRLSEKHSHTLSAHSGSE